MLVGESKTGVGRKSRVYGFSAASLPPLPLLGTRHFLKPADLAAMGPQRFLLHVQIDLVKTSLFYWLQAGCHPGVALDKVVARVMEYFCYISVLKFQPISWYSVFRDGVADHQARRWKHSLTTLYRRTSSLGLGNVVTSAPLASGMRPGLHTFAPARAPRSEAVLSALPVLVIYFTLVIDTRFVDIGIPGTGLALISFAPKVVEVYNNWCAI